LANIVVCYFKGRTATSTTFEAKKQPNTPLHSDSTIKLITWKKFCCSLLEQIIEEIYRRLSSQEFTLDFIQNN